MWRVRFVSCRSTCVMSGLFIVQTLESDSTISFHGPIDFHSFIIHQVTYFHSVQNESPVGYLPKKNLSFQSQKMYPKCNHELPSTFSYQSCIEKKRWSSTSAKMGAPLRMPRRTKASASLIKRLAIQHKQSETVYTPTKDINTKYIKHSLDETNCHHSTTNGSCNFGWVMKLSCPTTFVLLTTYSHWFVSLCNDASPKPQGRCGKFWMNSLRRTAFPTDLAQCYMLYNVYPFCSCSREATGVTS